MSDSATREWRFYLDDMIGFAEKVIVYLKGRYGALPFIGELSL